MEFENHQSCWRVFVFLIKLYELSLYRLALQLLDQQFIVFDEDANVGST
jgi:hypothetical protein